MATTLDNFIPQFAVDYVAIFTQDFVQLFKNARPLKVVVKEEAKLMEHPVESGATITDHRIILPIEIEISLILKSVDYQDTYRAIKQYYLNGTLLVIQTKSGVYQNQLIASMPHEEDPENYNTIIIALKLKQVQIVTAQYGIVPKNPTNTPVVDRGTQQGSTATPTQQSILSEWFS